MLKIGDKVKINYDNLDIAELDNGSTGEKYSYYIWDNIEKEYKIIEIVDCMCQYVLDDEYLRPTSFCDEELILI